MVKGQIVNVAEAQEAIKASLNEAQRYLGYRNPLDLREHSRGSHVLLQNFGSYLSRQRGRPITSETLIGWYRPPSLTFRRTAGAHVIPVNFVVDGYRGVRNPVGLTAARVEVESHVVMGERETIRQTLHAVENCNVPVRDIVLSSLASSESTLSQDEKEMGVVLATLAPAPPIWQFSRTATSGTTPPFRLVETSSPRTFP